MDKKDKKYSGFDGFEIYLDGSYLGYTDDGLWEGETRYIIEQFTGLSDKNGVEIYEGDIDGSDDEVMIVCWIEDEAAFGLRFPGDNNYYDTAINWRGFKKIGTIHENPELIKD